MRAVAMTLFPPRIQRPQARNKKRKQLVAFRPRHDQMAVLDQAVAGGWKLTEALITMIDLAIDLETELGDAYAELRTLAVREETTVGRLAGRAAKFGLEPLRAQLAKGKSGR